MYKFTNVFSDRFDFLCKILYNINRNSTLKKEINAHLGRKEV